MSLRFFREVSSVLHLPCERHTEFFSRQLDHPLTRGQRVGLWIHLRLCEGCRRFRSQLHTLSALHARERAAAPSPVSVMPADARSRINDAISRQS